MPPFTPLSVLGWAVGTLSLSLRLSRRPTPTSNHRAWIRKRVADVTGLLSCWPSRANRQLKRRWKRLSRDVVRHVDPKTLLRLLLNASCPDIWGLRRRVSAYTGIHLSRLPGCQVGVRMGDGGGCRPWFTSKQMHCRPMIALFLRITCHLNLLMWVSGDDQRRAGLGLRPVRGLVAHGRAPPNRLLDVPGD